MAVPAVVQVASTVGGLFRGSKQDAYKSNPRGKGLALISRADPTVWQNGSMKTIIIGDGVTNFEVPPGGQLLQVPGGKPDSGRLTAGSGGTRPVQSAAQTTGGGGPPPATTSGAGQPGAAPVATPAGITLPTDSRTLTMLAIGALILFLFAKGK